MALSRGDGARVDGAITGTMRHRVFSAGGDGATDGTTIPPALRLDQPCCQELRLGLSFDMKLFLR